MKRLFIWFKDGISLVFGWVVIVFLVTWITTAPLVTVFPRFSYGLIERWVCPAESSIQVQGTKGWFDFILADDEIVEYPQFTCVNLQGAVVYRGDDLDNGNAYWRIVGVVLLFYLCLIAVFVLFSRLTKIYHHRNSHPEVSGNR